MVLETMCLITVIQFLVPSTLFLLGHYDFGPSCCKTIDNGTELEHDWNHNHMHGLSALHWSFSCLSCHELCQSTYYFIPRASICQGWMCSIP